MFVGEQLLKFVLPINRKAGEVRALFERCCPLVVHPQIYLHYLEAVFTPAQIFYFLYNHNFNADTLLFLSRFYWLSCFLSGLNV